MNILSTLTFVPVSADSDYSVSLFRRPVKPNAQLGWVAQVDRRHTVSLADDGNLKDFECFIEVTIGEPHDGKENDESWDYAHGFLRWVDGSKPCLITLLVPAETFASLTQLAERGTLPSLEIDCIPGHGLENDGPYGPMKWDTTGNGLVPVKHVRFTYSFSGNK
jgi:hypothetical protein